MLSSITECPCLEENFSCFNGMTIAKALLNKAGLVVHFLWVKLLFLNHVRDLILVLALEERRCLLWSSNLQERMAVSIVSFALFAQVIIRADRALKTDSRNRTNLAVVASYLIVHLGSLVSCFLAQVIYHKSLECLGSIGLNLFLHYLDKITIDFILKSSRTKASTARESIFIDSRAIAFEAWESLFIRNLLLLLPNNLASYLQRNGFNPELASFILSLDEPIAWCLTDFFKGLTPHVLCVNHSIQLLFDCFNTDSVAPKVLDIDSICSCFCVGTLENFFPKPKTMSVREWLLLL